MKFTLITTFKKTTLILFGVINCFQVSAQNIILNPGFEDHALADGCYTNQSAVDVTSYLNNVTAFYGGTMDGIDVGVNSPCYAGGANSGMTHIVMAGLSGPNMFESISFNLSTPINSGSTYTISFYASNSNPSGSESLAIGISNLADDFGTEVTLVPLSLNTTYTLYSGTFVAPSSANFLTIQPAVLGNFWFGLDDFHLEAECTDASGTDVITSCDAYTWIDGNTYTNDNNTATFNIVGGASNGCDSLVTLNLTIAASPIAGAVNNGDGTLSATGTGTYQWIDCGTNTAVSGATSATFIPTANGDYAVVVTSGSCDDTSACVTYNSVGLAENGNSVFTAYPNPTTGLITINSNNAIINKIVVRDAAGRTIYETQNTSSTTSVDLSEMENGIYFITIFDADNAQTTMKVMKK